MYEHVDPDNASSSSGSGVQQTSAVVHECTGTYVLVFCTHCDKPLLVEYRIHYGVIPPLSSLRLLLYLSFFNLKILQLPLLQLLQ